MKSSKFNRRDFGKLSAAAFGGMVAGASVLHHACHTHNECKGEGGCGSNPGENDCKGKGKCAVPLSDDAWKKARANFEKAMDDAGKSYGPAPAKS